MGFRDPGLKCKPDFVHCMERVYAWYDHEIIDRAPVHFSTIGAPAPKNRSWPDLKARWFDAEYHVDQFVKGVCLSSYEGETFPVYFPNLGPNVYAAMLSGELVFGEDTSWMPKPPVVDTDDFSCLKFDVNNVYYRQILDMMDCAFEHCEGNFLVGYTDMHPGMDCADAVRGTENLLMDMIDDPDAVHELGARCNAPFFKVMDSFHERLKARGQLSVSWMGIPSYETMHIPSCDLGAMLSKEMFCEFALPLIHDEVRHFCHNVFHLDGPDNSRHLDAILEIEEIQAIQWVQGAGRMNSVMLWTDLIKRIQAAGKSVVVNLETNELEPLLDALRPEGIFLFVNEADPEIQRRIIRRLEKWK